MGCGVSRPICTRLCWWITALFGALACAFSSCRAEDVAVPGGTVDLQFEGAPSASLRRLAKNWVEASGQAVATYYGKFPVRHVVLRCTLRAGHAIESGNTSGWDGVRITLLLGRDASAADFAEDWVLVHEMIHLALPNLAERHHWLEEGLATYLEPIARVRAGKLKPEAAWADLVENLPQGLPAKGDRGLDHTPTWGRTYYGGALFCLRADLEIRRRTGNRRGLEHAMRAVLAAGGTIETSWKIDRVIEVGDAATGVPVLRELYEEMKGKPVRVDLDELWKQLGIVRRGDSVTFDNAAPLAGVRKAIMKK
jgi:hypothetical protein